MKEKTLYSYIEYDDYGGALIFVFVKEDGEISYRFKGWKNKDKRKFSIKPVSKARNRKAYSQKIISLFSECLEGNCVAVQININYLGEIGNSRFIITDAERLRKYGSKSQRKHPENSRRQHAKRDRELGYNQLNSSFSKSHGHHIDKTNVLYIPAFLHYSISHNVFIGKGMKEINALAFQWIATQEDFEGLKK